MSTETHELLQAFEALPLPERQEFAVEVLRRTRNLPFDSGPITYEEVGEAGRSLFSILDKHELESGKE